MKTQRRLLLEKAASTVDGDRDKEYGGPEKSFDHIAALWTEWYNIHKHKHQEPVVFTAADVAVFMMLLKIARLGTNIGHRDSILDIAGYAACLHEINTEDRDGYEQWPSDGGETTRGYGQHARSPLGEVTGRVGPPKEVPGQKAEPAEPWRE